MKKALILILFTFFNILNSNAQVTAKIGTQEWTAENLNVATFRNGDPIPEAKTKEEWLKAEAEKKAAWCYYDNNSTNGDKYGKLYNYYAVVDPRGLAPVGWHIPTYAELKVLENTLGGAEDAGQKLKSKSDWKKLKGNNSSGFNALPAGVRWIDGSFKYFGEHGEFWTLDEYNEKNAFSYKLNYETKWLNDGFFFKSSGHSVRCLRDANASTQGSFTAKDGTVHATVKIADQTWISHNLNVTQFRNGDNIPYAKSKEEWKAAENSKTPAWAYANFNEAENKKYGKIYNFYAVKDPRGLAPEGYHVASNADWNKLIESQGGSKIAGNAIRSTYGWDITDKALRTAKNSSGFSAVPNDKIFDDGTSTFNKSFANWWSTTLDSSKQPYFYLTSYLDGSFSKMSGDDLGAGHAVRCVKD